jgi:2-polyprenyl-6-methoxyphenol hydroxylase-like FAD-dependent oxidoreductase
MSEIDIPVLIVGGGPVGLLGARLVSRRRVRVMLAEKYEGRLGAPKAHALNPRSLEICAAAGLPMAALHAAATPPADGAAVRFVQSLAGPDIGALPYERQDDAVRAVTPWPLINIEQPRFEAILEDALAGDPNVDLRRGLEWTKAEQRPDAVISILTDRATGTEIRVRSRYLIAADGAGSPVREAVGIAMDGPAELQRHVMIHFEADLRALVGERRAILYFLFGPGPGGVFIAYDLGRTWVLMHPMAPGAPDAPFTEDVCRELVEAAAGAPIPDLAIRGVRFWAMSAQVAKRYRAGQVFLAGDAAHRFPPTGGLGLNTGVGDIDNLVWKIAAVEAGWAGPGVLDTYEAERRGVAQANMGQSLANAMRIRVLFQALGATPGQPVDPVDFARRLTDPAARAEVDAAVAYQKDHFDSLRLQLGYAYGDALKADDVLPISAFEQKLAVGARWPHAVLADGRSTLDLVERHGFTLLCGRGRATWTQAADAWGAPVAVRVLGGDFAAPSAPWAAGPLLEAGGAILVRPDGHVLAIADDANGAAALGAALSNYLRTPAPRPAAKAVQSAI